MRTRQKLQFIALGVALVLAWQWLPDAMLGNALAEEEGNGMQYLVRGTSGPSFATAEEAVQLLQEIVVPSLDQLAKLKDEGKILAGGLPVGDRAVVFIVKAANNNEVDQLVRNIPLWPGMDWDVTPLQSFKGRASMESKAIQQLMERTR